MTDIPNTDAANKLPFAMSDAIDQIASALSKAQGVIEGATKDVLNPHFRVKYADLASVWDACRKPLADNGLAVTQFPGEMIDNRMTMTTMLMHSSGQWVRGTLSIPLTKVDAQGYGSATTYARRYALAAVVGVCPEDDDGNAAAAGKGRNERPAERQAEPVAELNNTQLDALARLDEADTLPRLAVWLDDNKALIDKAPEAIKKTLRAAYSGRKKAIEAMDKVAG